MPTLKLEGAAKRLRTFLKKFSSLKCFKFVDYLTFKNRSKTLFRYSIKINLITFAKFSKPCFAIAAILPNNHSAVLYLFLRLIS